MDLEPTTIGRYKVLGELGRGAMGKVYLAEDPLLKRGIALKVVHCRVGDQDDLLARFQREAEISAQLNHPNVITIFDVGEEPEVGPFIAMERVDGPSLQEMLKDGSLEPDRAMPILAQAALALEAAHAAGIVHRDLKPANLLVDKSGRVKLLDFGIARREETLSTSSGLLCTPCYAAPELLQGGLSTAESDRWAFAVTAHQCLTGQMPFDGETLSAVLYAVAHLEPHVAESLVPDARAVFNRALARGPAERYPNLLTFMEELLASLPLSEEGRFRCRTLLDASSALGSPSKSTTPLPASDAPNSGFPHRRLLPGLGASAFAMLLLIMLAGRLWPRRLGVVTFPEGAKVILDGKPLGETPLKALRVPGSARLLRLEKEGFKPWEHTLKFGDKDLSATLEALPFLVDVSSDPDGAEVFLDGVPCGMTPVKGLRIPGEGIHKLQVRKVGYESWTMLMSKGGRLPDMVRLRKETKALPPKQENFGPWKRVLTSKPPLAG